MPVVESLFMRWILFPMSERIPSAAEKLETTAGLVHPELVYALWYPVVPENQITCAAPSPEFT